MNKTKKRPNNLLILLLGGAIGLPAGLIVASLFPEGSAAKLIGGLVGLSVPPVGALVYSSKKWGEYQQQLLQEYEQAKDALRKNANSSQAREAMLASGRAYYGCLREGGAPTTYDEQAINNDMKAITGG